MFSMWKNTLNTLDSFYNFVLKNAESVFCLLSEMFVCIRVWEVLALSGVIIIGKRWSCRRRPRADSWSLRADTKLLLMRTTAGDLFSPVLQHAHTDTLAHTQIQTDKQIHFHLHTHKGGKHLRTQRSERSRNLWRETGSRQKTLKYITVFHSTRPLLWEVRSPQIKKKIILISTPGTCLFWNSQSSQKFSRSCSTVHLQKDCFVDLLLSFFFSLLQ